VKSKKQHNETLMEIQPKMPVEHCISVLKKKTCQVFEVNTKLKNHTSMGVKYINSLYHKSKPEEIPGEEEKKKKGNKMSFKAFVFF